MVLVAIEAASLCHLAKNVEYVKYIAAGKPGCADVCPQKCPIPWRIRACYT